MDKSALRKKYIEMRRALTTAQLESLSAQILLQLQSLDVFNTIRFVHIFYPIAGKREVDTSLMAHWLRDKYPSVGLVLPKSDLKSHTLKHILWTEDTPLAVNEWGITEPETGEEISPSEIDLVLMPLLCFDEKGNRVGYGKGFYDRFLVECKPETLKVGLSYFEPEERIPGTDVLDVPMDLCITPQKIWRFNS